MFKRKQKTCYTDVEVPEPKEVTLMKQKTKRVANKAHRNAKKLNELLLADGITLKIGIATGSKND